MGASTFRLGFSFHGLAMVVIPFEDEPSIPIDMHMPRAVVARPGQENVVPSTNLAHSNVPAGGNTCQRPVGLIPSGRCRVAPSGPLRRNEQTPTAGLTQ